MTPEELNQAKEVEYYSQAVSAWFATRLEADRSLLAISAGAIGLFLTLLSAFHIPNVVVAILFILALLSFLLVIVVVLIIFRKNADYLQKVLTEGAGRDPLLGFLDVVAAWSFGIGVVLSVIIGMYVAINNASLEGKMSSEENRLEKTMVEETVSIKKSYDNAAALKPTTAPAQTSNSGSQNSGNTGNQGGGDKKK